MVYSISYREKGESHQAQFKFKMASLSGTSKTEIYKVSLGFDYFDSVKFFSFTVYSIDKEKYISRD